MASSKSPFFIPFQQEMKPVEKILIKRSILWKTLQRFSNHYMWTNRCNFRSQYEHFLQDLFSECSKNEVRYTVSCFDPWTLQVITCGRLSSFAQ